MKHDRNGPRHSADWQDQPVRWPIGDRDPSASAWPSGDEPHWPSGSEVDWERPPAMHRARVPAGASGRHRHEPLPDAQVTETLPPIEVDAYEINPRPEPELLTHRDDDLEPDQAAADRINALVASSEAGDDGAGPEDDPAGVRKRRWRRARRAAYAFLVIFVILPIAAFGLTYFLVDVPSPHQIAADQAKTVTYYYAGGEEMGRDVADGNRVMLEPDEIPEVVKHAVYAAEDQSFETNTGFDISGLLRAVRDQLSGGTGGGSTITMQYVKKATGSEERTLTRKATEVVKAFKMSRTYSKEEIITAYLNTIYLGRGAYGIEAASQAYFGKSVDEIDETEAAFLAGVIQAPSRADDPEYGQRRWNYVLDRMVENNWLSAADRSAAEFPELVSAENNQSGFNGANRYIKERVDAELTTLGYEPEQLRAGGYKIYTTIDKRAQELAELTATDVLSQHPDNLRSSLVAVDPETGGIVAYYGGPYDEENQTDWANQPRNPGSSWKVFDFLALLKEGKGPYTTYDGRSGVVFPGRTQPVNNSGGDSCGASCTVARGMEKSINTVFYGMVVNDLSPEMVAQAAYDAGIPEERGGEPALGAELTDNIAIGGDDVRATAREMAGAYATLAADGIRHDSHLVQKVTTPDDEVIYQATPEGEPAFDSDAEMSAQIAGNVTDTLVPVVPYSNLSCAGGRDCAGKTGTHQSTAHPGQNSEAWMVGYTRQVSVAVWVGTGYDEPLQTAGGGLIYGSTVPGPIWQAFINAYHEGMPNEPFGDVEVIGAGPPPPPPPATPDQPPPATNEPDEDEPDDDEGGDEDGDEGGDDNGNGNGNGGDNGDGDGDDEGDGGDNGGGNGNGAGGAIGGDDGIGPGPPPDDDD